MSLTSFMNISDVKGMFKQEFKKPTFKITKPIVAPPQTRRYGQVGTAYDYLLRFCLKRKYRFAVENEWIAKKALLLPVILRPLSSQVIINIDKDDNISRKVKKATLTIAQEIIQHAQLHFKKYKRDGIITQSLLKSALQLAQLDAIYRASYPDDNLGTIYREDINDLKRIISYTDLSLFHAKKVCLLNPTFGIASKLVGHADADLLIDDTLLEIKTTKNLTLARREFNQLIGYYVLYRIGHIDGAPKKQKINHIGIYYSRHNYLHIMDIKDIVNEKTFPVFIKWFKKRAKQEFN